MANLLHGSLAACVEALPLLAAAENRLTARDLAGSRSFAMRARAAAPTLPGADEILAVVDTLLAGDKRIGISLPDWYSVLRLSRHRGGGDRELIACQYRRLAHLLNPQRNKFPFAFQALRLVIQAWNVLSDPAKKSLYDKEIAFHLPPLRLHQDANPIGGPVQALQQSFSSFGNYALQPAVPVNPVYLGPTHSNVAFGTNQNENVLNTQNLILYRNLAAAAAAAMAGSDQKLRQQNYSKFGNKIIESPSATNNSGLSSFWTVCPYCVYVYEYPRRYVDYALRCQTCGKGFKAVAILPPQADGKGSYFYRGFTPLRVSNWEKNTADATKSNWMPLGEWKTLSPTVRVYADECEGFVEMSSSSENDGVWENNRRTKRAKKSENVSGIGTVASAGSANKSVSHESKNVVVSSQASPKILPSKKLSANLGDLDLDEALRIESEELAALMNLLNEPGSMEGDRTGERSGIPEGYAEPVGDVEGTGFFDGLDEFLRDHPISIAARY